MAERIRIQIRKNDQVKVIAGKDLNKTGRVLRVLRDKGRVVVEGVSFLKRHTRPNPQKQIKGGIVEREAPIHVFSKSAQEKITKAGGRAEVIK